MYCPRCGQEQTSENTRFCSRCGFLLETVSEVLANGGVLPQLAELSKNSKFLTRKNGIKMGVIWAIVLWFVLTPIFGIAGAEELTAVTAVLGFAGAVLIILISILFLDNKPQFSASNPANFRGAYTPNNLSGSDGQTALPPLHNQPVENYIPPVNNWKAPDTGGLVRPPGITEETTKLLQKDE